MALNIKRLAGPILEPVTVALAHSQCRVPTDFTQDDGLFALYISSARETVESIMKRSIFNQTWQRTLDSFPLNTSFDHAPSPADRWSLPNYGDWVNRLAIDLPMGRVLAQPSIVYTDCTGTPHTLAASSYSADLNSLPCRLTPSQGSTGTAVWPFQGGYLPGSVKIQWNAASFINAFTDSLVVSAGAVTISQAAAIYGETPTASLTSAITLADANGNAVPFTNANGVLTVNDSYNTQTLTATYYTADCPADIQHAILWLVAHYYRNPGAATDLDLKDLPHGVQAKLGPHIVEWTDYRPC